MGFLVHPETLGRIALGPACPRRIHHKPTQTQLAPPCRFLEILINEFAAIIVMAHFKHVPEGVAETADWALVLSDGSKFAVHSQLLCACAGWPFKHQAS